MQLAIATASAFMALLSTILATPAHVEKRSIPALQGWSGKNFSGTAEYTTFCTPDECCFPSKTNASGDAVPVNKGVQSLSLMYADVLLKETSNVFLWKSKGCKGAPIAAFNAFGDDRSLGIKTVVHSFRFST